MTNNRLQLDHTLIIGAGASKALFPNFGTGQGLVNDIANSVSDNEPDSKFLRQILLTNAYQEEELDQFRNDLQSFFQFNPNRSIDSFLDEYNVFPEFQGRKKRMIEIGRHLIAAFVLGWEGKVKNVILRDESPNWLTHIFDYIRHYDLKRVKGNSPKIHIVNFNYDRIIEHFLYKEDFWDHIKNKQEYYDYLTKSLHHVYGVMGRTREMFEYIQDESKILPFGADNNVLMADKVYFKTMHEDRHENEHVFTRCRTALNKSQNIAIMGFGFDEFNCRNIGLDDNLGVNRVNGRKLHVHLYETEHAKHHQKISDRRENIKKIRRIYPDVNFYFGSMLEFVRQVFPI